MVIAARRDARFFVALILCCAASRAFAEIASSYGRETGSRTASGERVDPAGMTAAHRTLLFGTLVRVTHDGRSVIVRINDRGPFIKGRNIDLTTSAARRIRCPDICRVQLEIMRPQDIYRPERNFDQ